MTEFTPQETPPIEGGAETEGAQDKPSEALAEEALQAFGDADAAPQEMPPEMEDAVGAAAGIWHTGKKITALWSINQNRNSWAGISGVGWRKLANNSDSAVVALTILASHAKQTASNANLREDSGQIKEMYVW